MKLGHRVIGAFAIIALVFAFLGEVLISRMQAHQDQAATARVTDTLRSTLNVAFRSERQFYFEVEESQISPALPLEWAIPPENEGLGTILLTAKFDSFVTLDADLRGILERIKLARAKLWESLQDWKASAKAVPTPAPAGNENMTVLGTVAPKPVIRRNMVEIRQLVQQIHDLLNRKEDILRAQEGTGIPLGLLRLGLYILVLLAVYLGIRLTRTVTNALTQASAAIEEVVLGEHKIQLDLKATDEIGDLHRTIQKVSETFGKVVEELRAVTEGMVDCRFNQEIHGAYSGQFAHIKEALNSVIKNVGSMIQCIKDITGVLTNSANDMKSIVGELQKSAESIKIQAVATEEISQSFGNMASTATSAEEISVNISNILSTAEQMSRNMNLIASSIEEVSRSITHVSGDAKQAAAVAGDAMKLAENATGTMNSLGTAAREIGKVTEVIKRIAEQTNLLALNATIEAASAGEAGKGFAVVAHEIKELANQSAQAAEGIADKISGVQTNTQDAVKVISEVAVIIRTIYGSVEGIAQVMEKETASATSISLNTQEAAKGISNITRAIAEISKGATDMSQVIGESAQGVTSLSTHVKAVSDALGHNTADVEKIHSSAEMVSGLSGELQILMEKFQV